MTKKNIPDIVVGRLPLYLRSLQGMSAEGRQVTSSQELGERLGISAAQIRKDLSQFGEFGKQGTGYQIDYLTKQIGQILHVDHEWDIAVVGAGDIGSAVSRYKGFSNRGFRVAMIFDEDPHKQKLTFDGFQVQSSENMVEAIKTAGIKIAMISVPGANAQKVAEQLVEAGVKAILNYCSGHPHASGRYPCAVYRSFDPSAADDLLSRITRVKIKSPGFSSVCQDFLDSEIGFKPKAGCGGSMGTYSDRATRLLRYRWSGYPHGKPAHPVPWSSAYLSRAAAPPHRLAPHRGR